MVEGISQVTAKLCELILTNQLGSDLGTLVKTLSKTGPIAP